jgi:hypothetical protein
LKILAATLVSRFCSNCVFRFGFLRLATDSTAQSGLKLLGKPPELTRRDLDS